VGPSLSLHVALPIWLPRVFAFPETRLDGPFAAILNQYAASRNLTVVTTNRAERPYLQSSLDGDTYLRNALSAHHLRGFRRLHRRDRKSTRLNSSHVK